MNWKDRYKFKPLKLDEVKKGMKAMLIVGDEISWMDNSWILGMKGKIFEVLHDGGDAPFRDRIRVKMPTDMWSKGIDDGDSQEEIDLTKVQGYYEVLGDLEWFTFKE